MADSPSINQFLSHAAHDIKQPLNVLQMYLGILQRRLKTDNSKESELEAVVSESMKRVQATVSLLSQWARAEENTIKQHPTLQAPEEWKKMANAIKTVRHNDSDEAGHDKIEADERNIDLALVQQTLQDITYLLPAPITCTSTEKAWQLSLNTSRLTRSSEDDTYQDELYQLAVVAGSAIFSHLGGSFTATDNAAEDTTTLQLTF